MPSPLFVIGDSSPGEHYKADYDETVTLSVFDQTGVDSVVWEVFGTSHDETAPVFNYLDDKGYSVELTIPTETDGDGRGYGIRATINGGLLPGTLTAEPSYSATSGIYVASGNGEYPAFLGETFEFDAARGWGPRYNIWRGSDIVFNGDMTGTNSLSLIGALRGVALSTDAPANNQVLRYNSSSEEIEWVDVAVPDPAGDVTGTQAATVVSRINGATVPAAGALTVGTVPNVSGSAALIYSKLVSANLASAAGVLLSQLQNISPGTLLGRTEASTGMPQMLTPEASTLEVSGTGFRIKAGSNGQFLQTSGGAAVWGAPPAPERSEAIWRPLWRNSNHNNSDAWTSTSGHFAVSGTILGGNGSNYLSFAKEGLNAVRADGAQLRVPSDATGVTFVFSIAQLVTTGSGNCVWSVTGANQNSDYSLPGSWSSVQSNVFNISSTYGRFNAYSSATYSLASLNWTAGQMALLQFGRHSTAADTWSNAVGLSQITAVWS